MDRLQIPPFPNLVISQEAFDDIFNNAVKTTIPKGSRIKKIEPQIYMANEYKTKEKRLNVCIPFKKNGGMIHAIFPDPRLLFLDTAIMNYNMSETIANENFIQTGKKIVGKEDTYFLDSTVYHTNLFYNQYLQYRIQSIIMLSCTVEAFINSLIEDDTIFINNAGLPLIKHEILWLPIKSKYKYVLPSILLFNPDHDYRVITHYLKELEILRNDFVHLKEFNNGHPHKSAYFDTFQKMIRTDIPCYINAVKDFINYINDKQKAISEG